jgi:hypothetical protein
MEQILAFVLGASIAIFIWVVVVAFKTVNKVEELSTTIDGIVHVINRNDELVNRRIDQEIDRTDNLHSESISFTNSRVDKLEQKLTSVDKNGCEPAKKLLKG